MRTYKERKGMEVRPWATKSSSANSQYYLYVDVVLRNAPASLSIRRSGCSGRAMGMEAR